MEARSEDSVALGLAAPDFELQDVRGEPVRLSQFRGKRHVVLVFSRGFL